MPPTQMRLRADAEPRERLLHAATALFCQRGITAVGVDTIVAEAATAKTTLYKLFGSKEQLVEEVLKREGEAWRDWFTSAIERSADTPQGRLRAIFPVLAQWFRKKRFYGCPFINAVAEHDKANDRLRDLALRHKLQVLAFIRGLVIETGADEPDLLTHQIALLIDGAIVATMITKDPRMAETAQAALVRLLASDEATIPT